MSDETEIEKELAARLTRLTDVPQAQLLLGPGGLIRTEINSLDGEPSHRHPRAEAYRERGMRPFTPYGASVPAVIDWAVIELFAAAGALDRIPRFLLAGQRESYRLAFTPLRVGILAAGGVAPGLNMVIDSLVKRHGSLAIAAGTREAADTGFPDGLEILGYRGGYEGLLAGDSLMLTHKVTDPVAPAPGCCLGIRRGRKDAGDGRLFEELAGAVRRERLDVLYVIGGDGTLGAADRLAARLRADRSRGPQGQAVRVVGAPKTMDNDILFSDQTFGYETAVEHAVECVRRIHEDVKACGRVGVVELFGAASGFVALDAANLSGEADDVLLPEECGTEEEQDAEVERISQRLAERWARKGHALAVVAEGAAGAFAHGQAAKKQANFEDLFRRIREATTRHDPRLQPGDVVANRPQHLIRSVQALASDLRLCKTIGKLMVDTALSGFSGCAVSRWQARYCLVPFACASATKRRVELDEDLVSIHLDKRSLA